MPSFRHRVLIEFNDCFAPKYMEKLYHRLGKDCLSTPYGYQSTTGHKVHHLKIILAEIYAEDHLHWCKDTVGENLWLWEVRLDQGGIHKSVVEFFFTDNADAVQFKLTFGGDRCR